MALSATLKNTDLTPRNLIDEGVREDAYIPGVGWKHEGLVVLAKAHGVRASRKEFKGEGDFEEGVTVITDVIRRGGVAVVSLTVPDASDTHLVPIIGYSDTGFYYHEPAADPRDETAHNRFISLNDFEKRWRRLALFIEPS